MSRSAEQRTSRDRRRLIMLVRRVARADERAFARLYDTLAPAVADRIRAAVPDPADVTAITSATFVEVWWLARFHIAAHADVTAWIMSIAIRRADERLAGLRAGTGDDAFPAPGVSLVPGQAVHDRGTVLVLAALPDQHVRSTTGPAGHRPRGISRAGTP